MSLFDIRKTAIAAAIGLTIFVACATDTSAQTRREIRRERQRIEREQQRLDRQGAQYGNNRVTERQINNANYRQGYEQGMIAGQYDRRKRKYNLSNVYRGTGAYPNGGDPTNTDYIYRQGYLQGYDDGFHGRNY
jgi:hypothetical protein